MSHDNAVGRNNRATENGNAQVEYPPRCLLRHYAHHNKEGHGRGDRRPDDYKAPVEPVRKPAKRPGQQKPSESTGCHEYRNSGRIESTPLRANPAHTEERARAYSTQ